MPSVKIKVHGPEGQTTDKKTSEENFNKALKSFQKISQETKRQTKKYEYFVSPKVEKRTKRIANRKNKKG